MPTIVVYKHDKYNILKQETYLLVSILVFMSSWKFMLSWVEHEKSFITSRPDIRACHNKTWKEYLNSIDAKFQYSS